MNQLILQPIGVIHSPFTEKDQTPIQVTQSQAIGQVVVFPEFADGLKDVFAQHEYPVPYS